MAKNKIIFWDLNLRPLDLQTRILATTLPRPPTASPKAGWAGGGRNIVIFNSFL